MIYRHWSCATKDFYQFSRRKICNLAKAVVECARIYHEDDYDRFLSYR